MPTDLLGLPKWLQAVVVLGVPSVIALFLVYVMTTGLVRRVSDIERTQAVMASTLAALAAAVTERQRDAADTREHFDDGLARLERQIRNTCMVAATSADERTLCGAP